MVFVKFKYIDTNIKKGRVYRYYKRGGRSYGRIHGELGTAEFNREYERFNEGFGETVKETDTFNAAAALYIKSAAWREKSDGTKKTYAGALKFLRETFGTEPIASFTAVHINAFRDQTAHQPATCNLRLAVMAQVLHAAVSNGLIPVSPMPKFKKLKTGEYAPWTTDAINLFWGQGRADLVQVAAMALLTGQRKGDCLKMAWGDVEDGGIWVRQEKTDSRLWIPIHTELQKVIDGLPRCALTLLSVNGRQWTKTNFDNQFRAERKRLGIRLVFHGLRKNAATALAEVGGSTKQISSITGQSPEMVEHYTKAADQKRLAKDMILMLEKNRGGK